MADIVITWPKSRALNDYLRECRCAAQLGQQINFRVHNLPKNTEPGDRCFVVYRGFVRGYHEIVGLAYRAEKQVMDPVTGEYWPPGNYIVRDPEFHPILEHGMQSFQGWRYYKRWS